MTTARFPSQLAWHVVILLVFAKTTFAAPNSEWLVRTWETDDGLPNNTVNAIAQGPDGYLWIGTPAGLSRFDGVQFSKFVYRNSPANQNQGVSAILADPAGRLWIGPGNELPFGLNKDFSPVSIRNDHLPRSGIVALAEDKQGSLWVAYASRLFEVNHDLVKQYASRQGVAGAELIDSLISDGAGNIWVAWRNEVGLFRNGVFQKVNVPTVTGVFHLAAAHSNGVWIATGPRLFKCDVDGNLTDFGSFQTPNPRVDSCALIEDHSGAIWIGTDGSGLFRRDNSGFQKIQTSHPYILSLAEDDEGNIWAGTEGGGLDRISPAGVQLESMHSASSQTAIQSICQDTSGNLWGVTQNGFLVSRQNGEWELALTNLQLSDFIACVAADRQGNLWIGTRDERLYRWRDNQMTLWNRKKGLMGHEILTMLPDSHGDLWLGEFGTHAVQRLANETLQTLKLPGDVSRITALAEDAAGNIWAGSQRGILMRAQENAMVSENSLTGSPGVILALYATPDGALWIGYEGGGLGRLKDGHFSRVTTEQGLFDNTISEIISDGQGWLWFGCERGIFKVRQSDLENVMDGWMAEFLSIRYGQNEGLFSVEANSSDLAPHVSPAPIQSRDGRIWMPLRTAIAVVDPTMMRDNARPPRVFVTGVTVDGETIASYGDESAEAANLARVSPPRHISPWHSRLDFHFTVLNFSTPENVHFQYELQGFDRNWINSDGQRTASYSRLAAGHYEFKVRARNGDGTWGQVKNAFAFTVPPFFWQSWWFESCVALVLITVIIVIVRYISLRKLHLRLQHVEQLAALDKERARIARDIHDDLGGSMTQIMLLSGLVSRDLADQAKAKGHAQDISSAARHVTDALDEIVWAISPRNDTLPHLVSYIGQFTSDFLRTADIEYEMHLPQHPPETYVSAEARHNLFLVVKEAFTNIARHSRAGQATLTLTTDDRGMRMVIQDDGCGFDSVTDNGCADGLRNMRQRMQKIGGAIEIQSKSGGGTTVFIQFPFSSNQDNHGHNSIHC